MNRMSLGSREWRSQRHLCHRDDYRSPHLALTSPLGWRWGKRVRLSASSNYQVPATFELDGKFQDLLQSVNLRTELVLAPTATGSGLITSKPVRKDQVLLTVPRQCAIVVDYSAEMRFPAGDWPRLTKGAARQPPSTWEGLMALALLDALAGNGSPFWQSYVSEMFPDPLVLTLPMCWGDDLLSQLQHEEVAAAARAQQERLRGEFPTFAQPVEPGGPSWMQWAFACVRSRSFRVGVDAWALVPFLDMSNHNALRPSGDFRSSASGDFELLALRDMAPGEEVSISYTGAGGATNRRLMVCYGFVPEGGNPADRLGLPGAELDCGAADQDGAGGGGGGTTTKGSGSATGRGFSLADVQDVLGEERMAAAAGGRDNYLWAAIKSLPLDLGDGVQQAAADRRQLAEDLMRHVIDIQRGELTSLADDLTSLSGTTFGGADVRHVAALRYRIERKRLLEQTALLLRGLAGT